MTSPQRSHQRIFGSKVVFPALRGYVVEYDFGYSPKLTEAQVKSAILAETSAHGVEEGSIQVRTDHAKGHAYIVARLQLDKKQFDTVTGLVSEAGWVQHHFLDQGLVVVGMRIETRILVSFAANASRHRAPDEEQQTRRPQDFDRGGRHYELSHDGQSWVDTGPAKPCCGCS
jgi:hypothetical protein